MWKLLQVMCGGKEAGGVLSEFPYRGAAQLLEI